MIAYVIRRLLQLVPVVFAASIIVFSIMHIIPGDPAVLILGFEATPEQVEVLRQRMGFDKPLPEQYLIWLGRVVRGDLGESGINHYPVAKLVVLKFAATVELTIAASGLALVVSLVGGILSAVHHRSWLDYLGTGFTVIGLAVPTFWLGVLLILIFSVKLGWLPAMGRVAFTSSPSSAIRHLVLPSVTLAVYISSVLMRYVRSSMLETMDKGFVLTARAKGLSRAQTVRRHVLRNAFIPVLTALGLQVGMLLGGAVVTEAVFDWPGLGSLILSSILQKDYVVVQGSVLFFLIVFAVVNLLTDVLYAVLDPRIRYG